MAKPSHDRRIEPVMRAASRWHQDRSAWAFIALRFVPLFTALNLLWEFAHLPLYTIWEHGRATEIAFAAFHCTFGDVFIGLSALLVALIATGAGRLDDWRWSRVTVVTVAIGVGYTAFSEWINAAVRASWAYSDRMPVLPIFNLGLSPLVQWLVVPSIVLWLARWQDRRLRQEPR